MPANITLGDNYEIDEDSSGNLVIKDSTGSTVLQHTDGGGWTLGANFDAGSNDLSNVGVLTATSLGGNLDAGANNISNIDDLTATNADISTLLANLDAGGFDISNIGDLTATNADIGALLSSLDAGGFDISNIGTLSTTNATVSSSPSSANDVAIKEYVDSVAQGLDWQDSVIDELNDPPGTPSDGDRYLIDDNPTGDWSGHPNEIAEYDGSVWEFFSPNEGWAVFLEDTDLLKVYDNADWIEFGSAIDHGALAGLSDDDHTQYVLVDGTRAMSGSLDMGTNAITNASDGTFSGTVEGSTYTVDGGNIAQSVVASGSVTLSSGTATVDTGVSESTAATFTVALGPDTDDADVAADIRANSAGNYVVDIEETDTSVGNPTVLYDIIRVR